MYTAASAFVLPLLIFYIAVMGPIIKSQKEETIWECREFYAGGLLGADCSEQSKEIGVPTNLNANTQILNLSKNKLRSLRNGSFDRYKDNLVVLDLSLSATANRKYDTGAFAGLKKLLHLNLSLTCLPLFKNEIPFYPFPNTVKSFYYKFCIDYKTINLTTMTSLEELNAEGCKFTTFPIFDTSLALIRQVNLRYNTLEELDPLAMAPYCNLERIEFYFSKAEFGLNLEKYYCQCVRVKQWLDDVETKYTNLTCTEPNPKPLDCIIDPGYEAIMLREKCLQKYPRNWKRALSRWRRRWRKFFNIFLIVLLLLVISLTVLFFIGHKFGKTKQEAEESKSETKKENAEEYVDEEEFEVAETLEEEKEDS